MFSRSCLRNALEPKFFSPLPSSAFLRSIETRACLHQATPGTQFQSTRPEIPPQGPSSSAELLQSRSKPSPSPPSPVRAPELVTTTIPSPKLAVAPTFTTPLKLTPSLTALLPHLATQPAHYITAHLHARPYLLTVGDQLRLPFRMPNVQPGDIIRLNRASNIGSRDFTMKGSPYLDERLFECRLRVTGTESEPLRIKEKTKRRQRHVRRIKSKHKYTILRVIEVRTKQLDELIKEGAEVVG
ncbi:hypothetical protein FQN57_000995 [Myotisia sp. PD_48]|nr:hypothetical protein FQN57_000995 [Myotisia sp. PD_48]